MNTEAKLRAITKAAEASIASERKSWDVDGAARARKMADQLEAFKDGVRFAMTGHTKLYNDIVSHIEREQDPEYAEFLRLKQKFCAGTAE